MIGANGTERVLNYHWREWNGKSVERLKNGEAFLDDIFKKEQVSQTCADSPERKLRNVRISHNSMLCYLRIHLTAIQFKLSMCGAI